MAQRTEKEEQPELIKSVPEALTFLCINNCGMVGNPATNNMCQKCFLTKTTSSSSRTSCSTSSSSIRPACFDSSSDQDIVMVDQTTAVDETKIYKLRNENVKNRCFGCRKKVGLTGFRCRCGELFCGEHRYSDRHNCSYDYKTVGREMIARENPVVKAAKIVRI